MNFLKAYLLLERLDTATQKNVLTEAKYVEAGPINLADCRMITSDVRDIRGEFEASACLEYNGELTRVQVRTVIIRDTENGKEFLGKAGRNRVRLPGGGFDANKDKDILDTAEREAYEEFNLVLTNLKDTGIHVWSSRKDSWVAKHIANEEDRWTGYYTWYVVANVKGIGDNAKPEEINKWQWLPIERLGEANAKLPAFVDSLNEAIHPDKKGRTEGKDKLGLISYLCESLSTLRKILSRMEIQKTYVREVRWEKGERPIELSPDGKPNTRRVGQLSVSTSTNLTGHAKRRADKWGFGVILDGAELSKYYDIKPYNHADHKLAKLKLNKIVRLTPEAAQRYDGSRVILMFGEYGNRLISSKNNTDLEIYDELIEFLDQSGYIQTAKTLNYYASNSNKNTWRYMPFGSEGNKNDSRFINLLPSDIESMYVWPQPVSQYGIPVSEIDAYFQGRFTVLMGQYSSFNEEEERIWIENELMNFIQIPPTTLVGLVLPSFFEADYFSESPINYHIAWLKRFAQEFNLKELEWHDTLPEYDDYYRLSQDQLNWNNTSESEQEWVNRDAKDSDFKNILRKAYQNRDAFKQASEPAHIDQIKADAQPISLIATAAVKLAIKKFMSSLTATNYEAKYEVALGAAIDYLADALLPSSKIRAKNGGLTPTGIKQMTALFNYYCPDLPDSSESNN